MSSPDLDLSDLEETWGDWPDTFDLPSPVPVFESMPVPPEPPPLPGYGPDPELVSLPDRTPYCSTGTTLAVGQPPFSWDVNGWYRTLGIGWPYRVPSSALAKYYLQVDGPNNARATYVLKRLLDKQVRREYDLMPLGTIFLGDERVQQRIRQAANRRQAQAAAEGVEMTEEDLYDELGLKFENNSADEVDKTPDVGEDPLARYSYWIKSMDTFPAYDDIYLDHLCTWRKFFVHVCTKAKLNIDFSLGLMETSPERYEVYSSTNPEHTHNTFPEKTSLVIFVRMDVIPTLNIAKEIILNVIEMHPELIY